jgi:S-DNA-T family DNA segregation ATPase FtsK/SpoIIIE
MKKSNNSKPTDNNQNDPLVKLYLRFRRFTWDIAGVLALAFALMTLLALVKPSLTSGLLVWWVSLLKTWFGWGSLWLVAWLAFAGLLMLRYQSSRWQGFPWRQVFALELAAFTCLALLATIGGNSLERAEAGLDGGRIGWALAHLLAGLVTPLGEMSNILQIPCLSLLTLVFLASGIGLSGALNAWIRRRSENWSKPSRLDEVANPAVSVAPLPSQAGGSASLPESRKKTTRLPAEFRKKLHIPGAADGMTKSVSPPQRDERLPGFDLLVNELASRPDERHINLTAGLIEKTLSEFGLPAKVVGFRVGPTVTQFAVEPGLVEKPGNNDEANRQKIRVAQISALSRDLALALSAERLRIQAPVPGRPYVGIEVPNSRSTVVRLRPILESEAFYRVSTPLAIALGRDVSGQPVIANLESMPHLLIAGTTGSGKSVCIAAITTCLVMNNTPEDLRMVMIDPKMVELVRFNGLPHLFGNVETNLERILGVLHWTVAEMDRRFRLLETTHSRNLDTYNRKARRRRDTQSLPRIVVIIDELADLMMSAPEQTEPALVRLAQMARATGIHLVMATQRPSIDVVTGLIKANFPARISFAVASSVDSRVILDTTGAEALLGHGDMLFMPPETSAPLRSQGVMVSDQEVERVITFWQNAFSKRTPEAPPWEELLKQEAALSGHDDLIKEAVKIVRETQRASASMLQRRLRIGYPRAARLIDELEKLGVVGPAMGGGREREVFIAADEDVFESEGDYPHDDDLTDDLDIS